MSEKTKVKKELTIKEIKELLKKKNKKFKKPLRRLPAEDTEYKRKPYNPTEGNSFKKEYEKKELKVRDISDERIKQYLERKVKKNIIKKNVKNLSELKPMKPIEGGGFEPIGKPVALKKNYANAYKKKS